jgi:hypothetical protein
MRIQILIKLAVVTCLVGGLTASSLARTKRVKYIPDGTWGTLHMRIQVENGAARIEYDCAHGTINGPLKVDSKGRFNLLGTHVRERPGPIRIDQTPADRPARYTGWTDGRKMTLTVTLEDGSKETVGKYELTRGQSGRVFKCN